MKQWLVVGTVSLSLLLTACAASVEAQPQPSTVNSGSETPAQAPPTTSERVTAPSAPPTINKSQELEVRFDSIVAAVRVPVQEYPDSEAAYGKMSENLEKWLSLKPSKEDVAQFNDYMSSRQPAEFNGSAGVVIEIDRKAYTDTMFVDGDGGAFAEEINKYNTMLVGNHDLTYNDETPYHLTYKLIDEPSISAPASNNHLSPSIATYQLQDNADKNQIGKINAANGHKSSINESHGVYMELVVVGAGANAEWKIQNAKIINRKQL